MAGKNKCPAIMVQGLSSNVGKSVLAAGLCRALLQDGHDVFPHKAQNIALNSFVTRDGREIGRAQAVQARACRKEPDWRMNPLLLKPGGPGGCQVVLAGVPAGNMSGYESMLERAEVMETVRGAYDSLAAEAGCVVIEGAGSPAEVNLKDRDMVNMRTAAHAGAPVLLVGDIDRGGVYAWFVGTMEVLDQWERDLVAGFVVNRFRGDPALLGDAHDYVLARTGKPVLGVVPFIDGLGLPGEDSVEFKESPATRASSRADSVEVAFIDLPHLSNINDLDPLLIEPDVTVKVIRAAEDLADPAAIILPGSKNVVHDIGRLRASGLAARIVELAAAGARVVGLCGGYQMLGRMIEDRAGVESGGNTIVGLGLLPLSTVMMEEKTLGLAEAVHVGSGLGVKGYEIHHGRSEAIGAKAAVVAGDGRPLGHGSPDGRVFGTYLHGLFDDDRFRRWYVDRLREDRGLAPLGGVTARYDIDAALDRLADIVRQSLPMAEIKRLMGL